jgi:arginyl-tRNA synthetase
MKKAYQWANVIFNHWFFESEMDAPSVLLTQELFNRGVIQESEGALGLDLTAEKLGFCMLLKRDGTGLYATKDILLAKLKFEQFNVEKSIYVVDDRQALHFKQVFKVLEKIGFPQASQCFHLSYNVVDLPDGTMSSRKGNIIGLMSLVQKMEEKITTNYLEKYRGQWTDHEIATISHQIAQGAIKYGMVRIDPAKKIIFDMDEWLKLDGETGPYLQYAGARIKSILLKAQTPPSLITLKIPQSIHPLERELQLQMAFFNQTIIQSTLHYRPALLCNYLTDLSRAFHSFYAECPILKSDPVTKEYRLQITQSVLQVLEKGLSLLGISLPAKM